MTTGFIVNHLWQSSCFVLLAALLALALRKNSPKVHYWVWLSASLKFLAPLALLVSLGNMVPWPARHAVSVAAPVFPNTLVQIAEPFSPTSYSNAPAHGPIHWVPIVIGILWALGFFAIMLVRCRSWVRIRANLRASTPVELPIPIPAFIAPGAEEPGIVGFLRPALVLPAQLLEHLNPRQLDSVLAHEMCHVRRRDNLFAAIHMLVEAIFWFHPLVWWIGSRLVEERELACDEEVLRMGCEPTDYIEGILKVCRLYTESPLPCVSGVTGADVKERLRAILTGKVAPELTAGKKLVLMTLGLATLAAPIVIGTLNAPAIRAQSTATAPQFEVASIRVSKNPEPGGNVDITPGRFRGKDLALQWLILVAYRINSGNLSGDLPSWTLSERYDIDAKTDDASGEDRILLALQALLKERFQLREHREIKEESVYFLTIGKNGIKMSQGSCVPVKKDLPNECYSSKSNGLVQTMDWRGVRISDPTGVAYRTLAGHLSINKRPVIDKTGLAGTFDVHLRWTREPDPAAVGSPGDTVTPAPSPEPSAPSIFDAMEEQLGLKLESGRGPVEYLVVDHVENPSEN